MLRAGTMTSGSCAPHADYPTGCPMDKYFGRRP